MDFPAEGQGGTDYEKCGYFDEQVVTTKRSRELFDAETMKLLDEIDSRTACEVFE
jgi:hypothetical protein